MSIGTTVGQLIMDGLAIGLVYVLMSSGFNLVVSVSNIIFIAFGEFYMLGGFITWYVVVPAHLPYGVGVVVAAIVTGILGFLSYILLFKKIQYVANHFLVNMVIGVGIMLVIGQGALLLFGTDSRGLPAVFERVLNVGGIRVSVDRLMVIGIALVMLGALHLLLQKTRIGRGMRAVSIRADVATLQGVNARQIFTVSVAIGCALAGLAGAITAPLFGVDFSMRSTGFLVLLVVMLGGVGSMPGAILGGIVFGLTLSFGQYYIGGGIAQIIFFLVVMVILIFRPNGLLSKSGQGAGHE
jgi:branched-chain amino acid transport system permease protein